MLDPAPHYIPLCATETDKNVSADITIGKSVSEIQAQIASRGQMAFRNIRNLVYRLRACDYFLSIYAWNTRLHGHTQAFDYSWTTGCNSFLYESENANKLLAEYIDSMVASSSGRPASGKAKIHKGTSSKAAAATKERAEASEALAIKTLSGKLTALVLSEYDLADDLSQRVQSCAAIVNGLAYPPNARRFFCTYGGFIGAFLTASATAFGRRWGGTNTSTQSQVQGLGTVTIALPALCAK